MTISVKSKKQKGENKTKADSLRLIKLINL
jgi:hypothetical protein